MQCHSQKLILDYTAFKSANSTSDQLHRLHFVPPDKHHNALSYACIMHLNCYLLQNLEDCIIPVLQQSLTVKWAK